MVKTNDLPSPKLDEVSSSTPLPPLSKRTHYRFTNHQSNNSASHLPVSPVAQERREPTLALAAASSSFSPPILAKSSNDRSEISEEANMNAYQKVSVPNKNKSHSSEKAMQHDNSKLLPYLVSRAAEETTYIPTLKPGAVHVQRSSPAGRSAEWDPNTQPMSPVRDESPDMVVTAKVVPNEEDLTELLDQRLQEKIQQAVVVEGVDSSKVDAANSSSRTKQEMWKTWRYILLIFVVGMAGIATGVTISLKSKRDNGTTAPSASPTITPDLSSSSSLPPNISNNNICSAAVSIDPGNGNILGTITNNTGSQDFNNSCGSVGEVPSVWYSLVGDGNTYAISTCTSRLTFDSALSVITGSCDSQECVAIGTDYYDGCEKTSADASIVIFRTEVGAEYFISVENPYFLPDGGFELDISIVEAPINDLCSSATSIEPGNGSISGSITNVPTVLGFNHSCFQFDEVPRVWYSLLGDGNVYAISMCTGNLTFDLALSVSTGSCDSQECVAMAYLNYYCEEAWSSGTRVLFRTEFGAEYFIAVETPYFLSEGGFELDVSIVEAPSNHLCSSATSIEPGNGNISGSITNAPAVLGFNHSCGYSVDVPIVWYSLVGDGNIYAISACTGNLTFDLVLSVSTGSCDSQECIAIGQYNECEETRSSGPRVVFRTEVGVEYYIPVENSYNSQEGEFELDVSIVEELPNDVCSNALLIQPQNGSIIGSTENAFPSLTRNTCPDIFDDSSFISPDVWYRVEGTGTRLTASMCGTKTTYDSQIAIFEGSDDECNQLCIAGNDDSCDNLGSAVEWFAEVGSTYYIRVFGRGPITGSFELKVD